MSAKIATVTHTLLSVPERQNNKDNNINTLGDKTTRTNNFKTEGGRTT